MWVVAILGTVSSRPSSTLTYPRSRNPAQGQSSRDLDKGHLAAEPGQTCVATSSVNRSSTSTPDGRGDDGAVLPRLSAGAEGVRGGALFVAGYIRSMGMGKMMVELCSAAMLLMVCRYLSCGQEIRGDNRVQTDHDLYSATARILTCRAQGFSWRTSEAALRAWDAFCSPSAAITCKGSDEVRI